jgi:hypothetical protein
MGNKSLKAFNPFISDMPHEQHNGTYKRLLRNREIKKESDKVILKRKGRAANI